MGRLPAEGPAGGSVQLGELIDEHGEALLFDLQNMGVDLYDLWRPNSGLTPRKVLWLVGQLPQSSAFAASCRGGAEFRSWTVETYLLAAIANLLQAANRQRAGKRSAKPVVEPPKPKRKPKRVVTVSEIIRRREQRASNSGNTHP